MIKSSLWYFYRSRRSIPCTCTISCKPADVANTFSPPPHKGLASFVASQPTPQISRSLHLSLLVLQRRVGGGDAHSPSNRRHNSNSRYTQGTRLNSYIFVCLYYLIYIFRRSLRICKNLQIYACPFVLYYLNSLFVDGSEIVLLHLFSDLTRDSLMC